jgi:hypothetical protein
MNIDRLRIFVNALQALDPEVKNANCNMLETAKTCGCHASLISKIDLPDLVCLYKKENYSYEAWADALAEFLGFEHDREQLKNWAGAHVHIWRNSWGRFLFSDGIAFGQNSNEFKNIVIIEHWAEVLVKMEQVKKIGMGL